MRFVRIGIDLGGAKIEGIALDAEGRVLARQRVPTPRGDYDGAIAAVVRLVVQLEKDTSGLGTVGIGMPGAISLANGRVKNANSTWLNGRAFVADMEAALGRSVRVANDANCFALSEAVDGAAAGADSVFGVIIGTGTGGGVVVNGRALNGANSIAGEWGHNMLPWPREGEYPGPSCYCGQTGCIETYLSGPGFEGDYAARYGVRLESPEICRRAAAGDREASEALERYADRLARGLASVINVLDPDVIVLGGGMSNISSLYEAVPRLWRPWVFSDRVDTRLVRAAHGDSSGVRGAAWLWPANE